jgi:hypothetical protein
MEEVRLVVSQMTPCMYNNTALPLAVSQTTIYIPYNTTLLSTVRVPNHTPYPLNTLRL